MGDILVTSIWNRVMITNFGLPATPVSLLIALRFFLSPLSIWAGFMSDTKPLFGLQRTGYIWLGRGLMILSLPLLGLSLSRFEAIGSDPWGWGYALVSFLLYGTGTLISGSPYLALVRESAPKTRQGLAISLAETTLIIFFAMAGIGFSFWMQQYDSVIFWQMILATMGMGGFFWFFAVVNVEQQLSRTSVSESKSSRKADVQTGLRKTLQKIWGDSRTRLFFAFLSLATLSAWMQDAILEPFGAEVFDFSIGRTTRLNSYWQGATVLTLLGSTLLWRKRSPEKQAGVAIGGLIFMALGLLSLGLGSLQGSGGLVEGSLVVFGLGFGVYTFGGLSLIAVMSPDEDAGAYLGLWTVAILVFKGSGTLLGGILRDLFLTLFTLPTALSYGLIFILAGIGLLGAAGLLARLDVLGFARDHGRVFSPSDVQEAVGD